MTGAFLDCGPFFAKDGEGRVLIDGVAVALDDGQFVTLEGPSGGGKSTLLRHITALAWAPDAVRRLDGEIYGGPALPAWRSRVSLLAQDAPMIPGPVRDNLSFAFLQGAGQGRSFDEARAVELLSRVGLDKLPLGREVRTLSGGERHRLALVRGLLWEPSVLVADEPLAGLDPEIADICFDLLLSYGRRPGRLVLCVLHESGLTDRVDRRLRLAEGRLEEVR